MSIIFEKEVSEKPLLRVSSIDYFDTKVVEKHINFDYVLYMSKDDNTYIFHNEKLDFYIIWKHIGSGNQILELRTSDQRYVSMYNKILEDLL